ncbi:hypothetical protein JI58_07155 [Marinosulfonomonas sp. PRT-SC04]|nr:hypothetical protein JI58_07155 [Marinosulfonomonas sp. PRT-SC04]
MRLRFPFRGCGVVALPCRTPVAVGGAAGCSIQKAGGDGISRPASKCAAHTGNDPASRRGDRVRLATVL